MAICDVCGNEIPDFSKRCAFCGSLQQHVAPSSRKGGPVRSVNLKEGMPPVDEGLDRLEIALHSARHEGIRILRIIHGYGSTGKGGNLKEACRILLRRKAGSKQIHSFLPGEDYSRSSSAGKALMKRHPALNRTERMDRRNPGITFVEL